MGRAIDETFKTDLLNGKLAGLLEAVKNDNTLIMELRGNQVIIYYRGGALYTISFDNGKYTIAYNKAYWRKKKIYDELVEKPSIDSAVKYIALYKHQMDYHRANADRELEKQGQQQLILENNIYGGKTLEDSNTSKIPTGDYFIVDMEYAYKGDDMDARFDLIALKWPSLGPARKKRKNLGISFLELKYYDGSMCGQSGIEKHISDFLKFTTDEKYKAIYHEMCRDMAFYNSQLRHILLQASLNPETDAPWHKILFPTFYLLPVYLEALPLLIWIVHYTELQFPLHNYLYIFQPISYSSSLITNLFWNCLLF